MKRNVGVLNIDKDKYRCFIQCHGVGDNDNIARSVDSYVSCLNSVAHHLEIEINPKTLKNEADIECVKTRLKGIVAPNTISNYCSAMYQYQYVVMVRE
ncbi:conserved hypothetical protein [Enterobacterales bacterium 8AC]|nr:conserved hypothetical protein [Enterobacterales bacterium 8AC]